MTCSAAGLPHSLSLGWVREHGRPVASKHQFDSGSGTLQLHQFDSNDAGSYVCQIKNVNDGNVIAEASIVVNLRRIQFQIDIRRPERIYLGEEITLTCQPSEGFVLETVEWVYPRGRVSAANPSGSNARCADRACTQLIINRWDDADNGAYQCSGCDAHGNSGSARVDLSHQGLRDFSVTIRGEGNPYEGGHFVLTCGGGSLLFEYFSNYTTLTKSNFHSNEFYLLFPFLTILFILNRRRRKTHPRYFPRSQFYFLSFFLLLFLLFYCSSMLFEKENISKAIFLQSAYFNRNQLAFFLTKNRKT